MENKKKNYIKIINEFIIYRIEEELNLLEELKEKSKNKISDNKINLNILYKKKCESLRKEYEYKHKIYTSFLNNVKDERIDEDCFEDYLKLSFESNASLKEYCFFLQNYFIDLYPNSIYEERNKESALKDILKELELDDYVYQFVKKSVKKNLKLIGFTNFVNNLINNKMKYNIEQFFPFAIKLLDEKVDINNDSILENIVLSDKVEFLINNGDIIDISFDDLKKHCFLFMLVYDYLENYLQENIEIKKDFTMSFLKCKNMYEKHIMEDQIIDSEKEKKITLLNKIIQEINSN